LPGNDGGHESQSIPTWLSCVQPQTVLWSYPSVASVESGENLRTPDNANERPKLLHCIVDKGTYRGFPLFVSSTDTIRWAKLMWSHRRFRPSCFRNPVSDNNATYAAIVGFSNMHFEVLSASRKASGHCSPSSMHSTSIKTEAFRWSSWLTQRIKVSCTSFTHPLSSRSRL